MVDNWSEKSIGQIKEGVSALGEDEQLLVCQSLLNDSRKGVVAFAQKIIRGHEKLVRERERLSKLWRFEDDAYAQGFKAVIGTDEVGRGPLAGPVVAAAVVLPRGVEIIGINDSKKLSEKRREALAEEIKAKAIAYQIAEVSAAEIDQINILHAAELAMQKAIEALPLGDYVLIDGQNQLQINAMSKNLIGGDGLSISIAAASIIAKVYRDQLMTRLDELYPQYHFAQNKGYGTAEHYQAIKEFGPCPIHRHSFRLQ